VVKTLEPLRFNIELLNEELQVATEKIEKKTQSNDDSLDTPEKKKKNKKNKIKI